MSSKEATKDDVAELFPDLEWPVMVELKNPVEFGKEGPVSSLTFRRGKMGDLRGIQVDGIPPVDKLLEIAARMCGRPVKLLEQLDDEAGAEVIALALNFFARCLGGGKKR